MGIYVSQSLSSKRGVACTHHERHHRQTLMQELLNRNLLDVRSFGMWMNDALRSIRLTLLPLVLDHLERVASLVFEDNVCGACLVASLIGKLDEVCVGGRSIA